jgi:hypothetical protein
MPGMRAVDILTSTTSDDVEPAENPDDAPPPVDAQGRSLRLVPAVAFDSVRLMRDAQTVLSSARILSFLPALVPRGDRPPGQGKRFVLRVCQEDLERAKAVLEEVESEADDEEPRCPRCKSWRVFPVSQFWKGLSAMVGLGPKPEDQLECLACHHRGLRADFDRAVRT